MILNGYNLGGWLSQSTLEPDHVRDFIGPNDINRIKTWGFNHVRLPIDYLLFTEGEDAAISEKKMLVIDEKIRMCVDGGLTCVLDLHLTPGHSFHTPDQNDFWENPESQNYWIQLWRYFANRYKGIESSYLYFDLLNEPTTNDGALWMNLVHKATEAIRAEDAHRPLVVEAHRKSSPQSFEELIPTGDSKTIYSFHFYDPLVFTHQKAFWTTFVKEYNVAVPYPGEAPKLNGTLPDDIAGEFDMYWDKAKLSSLLNPVVEFKKKYKTPIYCGEFGPYLAGERTYRMKWIEDVLALCKENDFGWSYWNYKNMGFGVHYTWRDFKDLPEFHNPEKTDMEVIQLMQKYA